MSDSRGISLSKVDLLTGTNYHIWELKVSAILRNRKLFKAVIENEEPTKDGAPGSLEARERETWEEKNDEAFGIIVVTLSEEQAGLFIGQRNAKTVWDELKRIHAGNVEDRKIDTALELKNIRMRNEESIDCYVTRARSIATRSAALGQIIPTREIVYHVVRGLHPKMEGVASVLRPQRSATLEEVQQSLREEEVRLNSRGGSGKYEISSKSEKAFKAKDGRGKPKNKFSERKCFVCAKPGHVAKDCWHRKDNESSDKTKFGTQGPGKPMFRGKPHGKDQASVARGNQSQHAWSAFSGPIENEVFAVQEESETELWTLDSGCTTHMSPRLDWMTDVKPVQSEVKLAEEGRAIGASALGNVQLTTLTSYGEEKEIRVNNVLYVPKLRANLLSVKGLINSGNQVVFNSDGAKIYNQYDELIGEALEKDRMFVVETKPQNSNNSFIGDCMAAKSSIQASPTERPSSNDQKQNTNKILWHKRLGHLNENYMDKLKGDEMVRGLSFESGKLGLCEPCVLGKLAQNPFRSVDEESTKNPLELIHMDLCGPMPKRSLGKALYMYVLVDSYSRRIFVYFLKSKEETFDCFVAFKNRRENELNLKIKSVRTDNGTEFVNHKFEELFMNEGIMHQRTVPYTPQSNGVAERANRTLLDKARTMLIDAELPIEFWAEAVAAAAYLRNCTPTKQGGLKTPIEKWNGAVPNVSHLKVFGSVVYYHIPKIRRNKLEAKAKRGIFVGYSHKRKAYRVFDPEDSEVHEVRTAKFDEDSKGVNLFKEGNLDRSNIDQLNYDVPNEETEEEDEFILPTVGQPEPLNEPDHYPELEPDLEPEQEVPYQAQRRPGRKPGDTNEVLRNRHLIQRMEEEERLIAAGARRSERLRNQHQAIVTIEKGDSNPKTHKDAMESPFHECWKSAMDNEIQSLKSHNVWTLTPRTPAMKVIKNKWVFTTKENPDGTVNKRKARLVAMGCSQRPGVDYEESFSPVMKLESLRILIALASQLKLKVRQYDVKTAYLHGELKETIFMDQPEGYIKNEDKDKVCQLQKSLYGLPQSGRCWNEKLNEVLAGIGLQRLDSDPCVYKYQNEGNIFLMGVYVDDTFVAGSNDVIIDELMKKVKEHFDMTETNGPGYFLGIDIQETEHGFELSQRKYVDKILSRFGLSECNPSVTPGDPRQDLDASEDSNSVCEKEYQEMIGSLMYLSIGTRPDITYNVCQLSQYSKNPKQIHLTAVKRVYRYLQGTKDYKLIYSREKGKLEASTDASWSSTKDAKSFTGYTVKLGNSLVSWKSRKQNIVALSTCEAELMALCEGVREMKWITSLLSELGMQEYVALPLLLKTDSKSAIDWITSSSQHPRTKHINRKYFFVKDEVKKGNFEIQFVRSEEMEADMLTKSLNREKLEACVLKLEIIIKKEACMQRGDCWKKQLNACSASRKD